MGEPRCHDGSPFALGFEQGWTFPLHLQPEPRLPEHLPNQRAVARFLLGFQEGLEAQQRRIDVLRDRANLGDRKALRELQKRTRAQGPSTHNP